MRLSASKIRRNSMELREIVERLLAERYPDAMDWSANPCAGLRCMKVATEAVEVQAVVDG